MLSIHVVLAWDRRATVQIDPACCVHELLERAQDALQQGISSLTTTSGQLLAGARIESNKACCIATEIANNMYPCGCMTDIYVDPSQILPIKFESNNPTWLKQSNQGHDPIEKYVGSCWI